MDVDGLKSKANPNAVSYLFLGGRRSGKSILAERQAFSLGGERVTYVATAKISEFDAKRIDEHQKRRNAKWETVEIGESPQDIVRVLAEESRVLLIDSIGVWIATFHPKRANIDVLVASLESRNALGRKTVIVSEEVGLSIHTKSEVTDSFVDLLGETNQKLGQVCHKMFFVVSGRLWQLEKTDV